MYRGLRQVLEQWHSRDRARIAVDVTGEVFSLSKQLGIKANALEKRLGKHTALPTVEEAKEKIGATVRGLFEKYRAELQKTHEQELRPLLRIIDP